MNRDIQNTCFHLICFQYRKSATQLVEEALKDPGLSEDDAVYVESFAMSLNDGGTSGCGETILGQMLTWVLLCI